MLENTLFIIFIIFDKKVKNKTFCNKNIFYLIKYVEGHKSGDRCWRVFADTQEEKDKWQKPLSENPRCIRIHPQKSDLHS